MNKKTIRALLLTIMMVLANMGGVPVIFATSDAFDVQIQTPAAGSAEYCETLLITGYIGPGLSNENNVELYYKVGSATFDGNTAGWTHITTIPNIKDGKYKDWGYDWTVPGDNTYTILAYGYVGDHPSSSVDWDTVEVTLSTTADCGNTTCGGSVAITDPEDEDTFSCDSVLDGIMTISGTYETDCCSSCGCGGVPICDCTVATTITGDCFYEYLSSEAVTVSSGSWDVDWNTTGVPCGNYTIVSKLYCDGKLLNTSEEVSIEITGSDTEMWIDYPESGATFDCSEDITITGDLCDCCNNIRYIEIYCDSVLLGNATIDGTYWSFDWTTPASSGTYSITAKAFDICDELVITDCVRIDVDCDTPQCGDISINMTEPATCGPCLCGPITFRGTLEGSDCVDHVDIYYTLEDGCNDYTPDGILAFAVSNGDLGPCPAFGTLAVSTDDFDASGNWEVEWNGSCDLMVPGLYKFIAVAEPEVQDGLPCIYDVEYSCVNNYRNISIDGPCDLICENTQISGTIDVPFCCNAVSCVNISYYDGCEWVCLGTTQITWEDCGCGCTPCTGSCCDSKHGTWEYCIDPCTLPNGCVEIKAEAVGVCGPFSDTLEVLVGNGASVEICYPDDCDLLCGMETVSGEISMMCEPDCGCDVPVEVYISDDGIDWTELNGVIITGEWNESTYYPCIEDCIDTQYKSWEVDLPTCQYEDGCYYIKAVVSDSCGCDSEDVIKAKINNTVNIEIIYPEEGENWYCDGGRLKAFVTAQGCVDTSDIGVYIDDNGTWEELDANIYGPRVWHVDCDCSCDSNYSDCICHNCIGCNDGCPTCPDVCCDGCLCDNYGYVDCIIDTCQCPTCVRGYVECPYEGCECEHVYAWFICDEFEACELEEGENTIMINVSGPCGPVSESVTFTVDNSADLSILNCGCNEVCGIVNITGTVSGCLVDGVDVYYGCGEEWIFLGNVRPYEGDVVTVNSSCGCGGTTGTVVNDSGVYVWSIPWNTCDLPNGPYTIRAVAEDECGNELTEEVCLYVFNQIPAIEITGPGCDESVCGLVTITGIGANCTCADGLEFYYVSKDAYPDWTSVPEKEWVEFAYIYLDPYDASNAWCELCDCGCGTHLWSANLTTCGLDDGYYWIRAEAVGDCGSLVNETSCIYVNATVDLEMIYPNMDSGISDFSGQEIIRGTSENSDCIENITLWYHLCNQKDEDWWLYLGEATIDENGDWEYIWNTCEMPNGCYCVKAVAEGICPGHSAETEAVMADVSNEHALISIESPESDTETGLYGVIPVAGTLEGWKCVDAITVNSRYIGDLEDLGDDGEWIPVETIDPTGYDWSLGFNSYGMDNGLYEIKASATGFEDSYTEDSVYILINNSGDGIGATPVYAYYAEGSEYIIVKFTEPVEIIDENAVDETFDLLYGDFGTGATMSVIDGNKVKIMLGSDANIDYIGLYGYDEGASAIAPKAGQTNLYNTGNHAPVSGGYEDIAAGMIVVTDGTIFSVPTFVNTEMMLEKAGIEDGAFVLYVTGEWEDLADAGSEFRPLIGYLYENPEDGVYEMPVYTTRQGALSEVRVKIANDYNLLALNNNLNENLFENADAGNWLWSLTKSSSSFMYVGAIFDSEGGLVGTYEMSSARFKTDGTYAEVSPYTAYWIPYAGTDGDTFYGLTMA